MEINLGNEYAVYTVDKQILFSGSYQECLEFIEQEEESQVFVDVDKTLTEYELEDLPLDYTFEDASLDEQFKYTLLDNISED